MKNKKGQEEGGGFGHIVGIAIAVFLVVIVAYIVIFYSIPRSTSNILEPLKKLVGIETKKAEASNTNTNECIIKSYDWSKNSAKTGENIAIIVEGSGNCDDKVVNINIFKDNLLNFDSKSTSFDAIFKENKIKFSWLTSEKGKFYFIFKFGTYTSPESERLKVE